MKNSLIAFIGLALAATSLYAPAQEKPGVTIYATGGTIAGSSKSNTDTTNYAPSELGVQALIEAVPELKTIATVKGEQIVNVASFDLGDKVLLKLAKAITKQLSERGTSGVVITHGTDTAEETAFFLDLTVPSPKPIVVVGAMRPATAISADGPMNLFEAVALAASPSAAGRGALIVLNDRIGSAYYTTKTNSTTLDTFRATEQGYLGVFISGAPHFFYEPAKVVGKPTFDVSNLENLPKVAIVYGYQDQDVSLIEAAVKGGAKGIVIAGTGNGSIPTSFKNTVKELMEKGVPVVRSTRTGSGYVSAKEEGIGAGFLNPQKARILLTLALAEGAGPDRIRGYFEAK